MRTLIIAAVLAVLPPVAAPLLGPAAAQAPVTSAPIQQWLNGLSGRWEGTLTYRDFQNPDSIVDLPMEAEVETRGEGAYVSVHYAFVDPGRVVYSSAFMSHDDELGILREASVDSLGVQAVESAVMPGAQATAEGWTFSTLMEDFDNNRAAEIRMTYARDASGLTVQRDVRPAGQPEFMFRNRITLRPKG